MPLDSGKASTAGDSHEPSAHEIATAPAEPELQVINLMEALRRSVAEVRAAAPENRKKSLASSRTRKSSRPPTGWRGFRTSRPNSSRS